MARRLLCCDRQIRTQKFLRVAEADVQKRQQQYDDAVAAAGMHSAAKVLSKDELEAFVDRLAQDAVKRDENRCAHMQPASTESPEAIVPLAGLHPHQS